MDAMSRRLLSTTAVIAFAATSLAGCAAGHDCGIKYDDDHVVSPDTSHD